VQVEARGITKECARCGVETAKHIWVREHFARRADLRRIGTRTRR
jgi:hypothetical protein